MTLPHLAADTESTFDTDLGISIAWRGGDWAIHFDSAVPADNPIFTLVITREDTDPPLSADGSNCTITFTAQTADHVAGKAVCPGLVWDDAFGEDLPDADGGGPDTRCQPAVRRDDHVRRDAVARRGVGERRPAARRPDVTPRVIWPSALPYLARFHSRDHRAGSGRQFGHGTGRPSGDPCVGRSRIGRAGSPRPFT